MPDQPIAVVQISLLQDGRVGMHTTCPGGPEQFMMLLATGMNLYLEARQKKREENQVTPAPPNFRHN